MLSADTLITQTEPENWKDLPNYFSRPNVYSLRVSMDDPSVSETTRLLRAWAGGDHQAQDELIPRVYRELRKLARHCLKGNQPGQTLQATDLVHEAYLRLADVSQLEWQHRNHFFAMSATVMRRILVDRARRRAAAKRGDRVPGIDVEHALDLASNRPAAMIRLDDALDVLARVAPRKARIVELRFFAGLGVDETAAVVGVSSDTVMRDWRLAKAWLLKEMTAP